MLIVEDEPYMAEAIRENTGEKLAPQLVPKLAEPFLRGTERCTY